MLDLPWLLSACPDLAKAGRIILVHGEGPDRHAGWSGGVGACCGAARAPGGAAGLYALENFPGSHANPPTHAAGPWLESPPPPLELRRAAAVLRDVERAGLQSKTVVHQPRLPIPYGTHHRSVPGSACSGGSPALGFSRMRRWEHAEVF